MRKSGYHDYDSFSGKMGVAFLLSSLLPYLVVIYLFVIEKLVFTDMFFIFALLILFSMISGFLIIRKSSAQLTELADKTNILVEDKQSKLVIAANADKELNDIAGCFNRLMSQLMDAHREMREQSVQLMCYAKDLSLSHMKAKEEERLRNRLSRYVGRNLVERLLAQNESELFENERREVTVLFADIRSFTSIAEEMEAEELVVMLNDFYDLMVGIVFKYSGVLDKFVGDQIVAVFGLLADEGDQASKAVEAALEMQQATEALMELRAEEGKRTFSIGIGINTGDAVVGNIGSRNRMDYTVIGDCVNVASRLQKVAKGGEIVIGDKTNQKSKRRFPLLKSANLHLKNKAEPVQCYFVDRTPQSA
jgi:class 3 adenylate cyclase